MSYYGQDGPGPAADPWEHSAPVGYDIDLSYPQPQPKEPAGSRALLIVLVSLLVVVLCGGGVAALYLVGAHSRTTPGTDPSATPTADPNAIVAGQCVANDGSKDHPQIRVTTCTPGTFKVLSKISGTSDKNRCDAVTGADQAYFYEAKNAANSFVLCLQTVS